MSKRPHRDGESNKKILWARILWRRIFAVIFVIIGKVHKAERHSYGSSSEVNTSVTLPNGLSPHRTNVAPISSTPNRKRHRRELSQSDRRHRKQRKRSDWMMSAIKQVVLGVNEIKTDMAALREEFRRLTTSTPQPSAVEGPIVQRVSTMSGYDELTTGVSDAMYRLRLVSYLSSIGGEPISAFAERIFVTLFTEDVAVRNWKMHLKRHMIGIEESAIWPHSADNHTGALVVARCNAAALASTCTCVPVAVRFSANHGCPNRPIIFKADSGMLSFKTL
ncbi:hypothetical protein SprV_0702249000 [Sparganum proliferum]